MSTPKADKAPPATPKAPKGPTMAFPFDRSAVPVASPLPVNRPGNKDK